MGTRGSFLRVKAARYEAQPSAEVENEWTCTSTSAYAFMGCTGEMLLVMHSIVLSSLRSECFVLLAFTFLEYQLSALMKS